MVRSFLIACLIAAAPADGAAAIRRAVRKDRTMTMPPVTGRA